MDKERIQKIVRDSYGEIAKGERCCECATCCEQDAESFAKSIGYSDEELKVIPDGANMALSCGNPIALANLKEGETVLDLGSGAGFDCFLAASKVGKNGRVIGVDMTPEMIEKAREIAKKNDIRNVEFRLGEIENLPVADSSVDVVISNCVINLSANKPRVFQEIRRVLKPGGRIIISDIALKKELPKRIRESISAYVGCIGGAILVDEYKDMVSTSGLKDVKITMKDSSSCFTPNTEDPIGKTILEGNETAEGLVASIYIEGYKPLS